MSKDPDTERGMYGKWQIQRTDGSTKEGGKHEKCHFYVLDVEHDKFSIPALYAYADECEAEYPLLAKDIRLMLEDHAGDRGQIRITSQEIMERETLNGLSFMKDSERLEFFDALKGKFCFGCGHIQPETGMCCQCENDE